MSRLGTILTKLSANACIEKGTSGDWTYKKYADGTVELWRRWQKSIAMTTAVGNWYRTADQQEITFPFTLQSDYVTQLTVASGQCHGVYEVGRSTTGTAFYPIRASSDSTANNRQINIYIWGKLAE